MSKNKITSLRQRDDDDDPTISDALTELTKAFRNKEVGAIGAVIVTKDGMHARLFQAYDKQANAGSFALAGAIQMLENAVNDVVTGDELE